jgi:hypothetical protein
MSDKPTDTDTDTDTNTSTSDQIPPLLFCRPEPMPGDSDDEIREAMEDVGAFPIQIDRPTLSIVNLSALAERIERATRGYAHEVRDKDPDHCPEMKADRDAIWDEYLTSGNYSARRARVAFVLRLIREALGGH